MDLLLAHGSRNAIFLVDGPGRAFFDDDATLREFVRRANDPAGPLGGGDGLYFVDDSPDVPEIGFYNADGSDSSFCGNGLRCVMRLLMERRGVDALDVRIGDAVFSGRRAADTAPGVPAVELDIPPLTFQPERIPLGSPEQLVDSVVPSLHESLRFTALAVPNPHLVALVEHYDEKLLVALGERIAAGIPQFPAGINLSFVLPLGEELFVRTFERGSGLTPSCGSGNVASRAVWARLTGRPMDTRTVIRNAGGLAASWTATSGDPILEGNATYVFRARLDPAALLADHSPSIDLERFVEEDGAYAAVDHANRQVLSAAGVVVPSLP